MKKRMLLAAALIGGTMFVTAPSFAKNEKIAVIIKATDSDFWQFWLSVQRTMRTTILG